MKLICIVSLLGTVAAGSLAAQSPSNVVAAVNSITAADVRQRISIIADDSMRGRYTPSPELEQVALYIAAQFKSFGLKPGGDSGGFLQRYSIDQVQVDTARSRIGVEGGSPWRIGGDALLQLGSLPSGPISGPTVLLTGTSPSPDMTGLGVQGAIVLVLPPLSPSGVPGPQTTRLLAELMRSGPLAVITVSRTSDSLWAAFRARQARSVTLVPGEEGATPLLSVREHVAAPVLTRAGVDLEAARRARGRPLTSTPLPDVRLTVDLRRIVLASAGAPNVVGILEGSDRALKSEYLVFSAHMDHVGVGRPDGRGDSIYNGADDDASGTTAVMELAHAFSRLEPGPKRSLIFLTVSGEERGLWGSNYFTAHPPVPMSQIVADLNEDMVGRNWKDTIVVIGRQQSDLGETLARVNAAHPELDMTAIDDLWPQERFYFRSDHYNFARRGVPILFFFNGTHPDYHRPSDELSKIDPEKESRIIKLVFYLGLELANGAERPKWNPESYRQIVQQP